MAITSGREKIEEEMKVIVEEAKWDKKKDQKDIIENMLFSQWKVILEPLKKKCDEDIIFNAKVMNPKLDIKHLFKYLTNKARELLVPGMNFVGLSDDVVIGWVNDFYSEDGELMLKEEAEEAERRAKEKAEREAKAAKAKKKTTKKADKAKAETVKADGKPEPVSEKKAEQAEASDKKSDKKAEPAEESGAVTENKPAATEYMKNDGFSMDSNGQLSFF